MDLEEPWCGACEWNLDHFPLDQRSSWFWGRMRRSDQVAGFRSDLRLAQSTTASPIDPTPRRVLVSVSALILLGVAAAILGGLYLIVGTPSLSHVPIGLVLLVVGAMLLPRVTRLKPMLADAWVVKPDKAPALHRLIDRVAAELAGPKPDVVIVNVDWNAAVTHVGLRGRKVLVLGVPLLLALQPRHLVALLAHELGHLRHDDYRRNQLIHPARTTFGRVSRMIKFPIRIIENAGPATGFLLAWQIVAGLVSWVLWVIHLAVNALASGDRRRVELRADAAAIQVAGTTATLETIDLTAMLPELQKYVQRYVPKGQAAAKWRTFLRDVRERELESAPAWRQLSVRTEASLFASHPAPGRRYQWLAGQPASPAIVVLDETEAERIEKEIAPYAEAIHRTMLDAVVYE
ncbi:M48 family metalloprotease [Actinoplanes sp. TBRC 11911]|uniref:M48 family metalloprotease n=1 Tax=Actinoplanes sp. TBRC 11911 TaxID=2729386 RepID=UPI00145DF7DC|nr:M48 family metallopeptidase [Actinoplanes sp. TBRC 11911]NMO50527.1 M48 family metalloprotease [Actinoplanes sp. TBRC 11911]